MQQQQHGGDLGEKYLELMNKFSQGWATDLLEITGAV